MSRYRYLQGNVVHFAPVHGKTELRRMSLSGGFSKLRPILPLPGGDLKQNQGQNTLLHEDSLRSGTTVPVTAVRQSEKGIHAQKAQRKCFVLSSVHVYSV